MHHLSLKQGKISFEDLLNECFLNFSSKFTFQRHRWPDARKLDRPLRSLQEDKLVRREGDYFYLTKKGEKQAKSLEQLFRQKKLF